jgi:antitoxin (DNA-binding transcriptional repressor) of toxin-antitoxin stability system
MMPHSADAGNVWPAPERAVFHAPRLIHGRSATDAGPGLVLARSYGYSLAMIVNVSELKDHLSRYLGEVRRGRSVVVCHRDRIIARIEPAGGSAVAEGGDAQWLDDLERRGTLRRATGRLTVAWLKKRPRLGKADVVAAVLREREEGP